MHIHILGICGTFMAGVARLAREAGHTVSGSDANVYPPMSTQLAETGIGVAEGYDPARLTSAPDWAVIGNALSRGNPMVEAVLDRELPYTSGPAWLAEHVLAGRQVLAVAGTHGKTTTSAMLAWILEHAGLAPGFLIGGMPGDFGVSARLGAGKPFVIEADEYDTAFFDKRSKFVHYRPRTLVINNIEYDHADIFPDLSSIQRQFHHLVRTVPGNGLIVTAAVDTAIEQVLDMGCWTPIERFAVDGGGQATSWTARCLSADGGAFEIRHDGHPAAQVRWGLVGEHNVHNGLAAVAAAHHAGVAPATAAEALGRFRGVRRRLERIAEVDGVSVYDDFAHHPTAIARTLEAMRARVGDSPITVVLEPRSNTMRLGLHRETLAPALRAADRVMLFRPSDLDWDLGAVAQALPWAAVFESVEAIVEELGLSARAGEHVIIMSNGGFGGIHARLVRALRQRGAQTSTAQ
ncbi:MAG: UDP-N-acetylmuramate:L-alanyl-gamma-D-glutamyl-meso-diaminopimelate ligase [Gammaproteobacteria bacterium]|nr:UDP-N-acetylmuramate:L-alanyl-gamma-D-glutamyl-meso-diaminopimelate ligase [Gammaproteobacteria bacterium]